MMDIIRRALAYGSIGMAKETARRAWKSESLIDSAIFAAQTGMLSEAAKNLLGPEIDKLLPGKTEEDDRK